MCLVNKQFWNSKNVIVTGGASFIGSHLVEDLLDLGASVTVIDNFSSGTMKNLEHLKERVKIIKYGIKTSTRARLVKILKGNDIVFHLAAKHGGGERVYKFASS
ncbi:MAG: NAD-dependent epimerase/dehydratase family protein [Candidatus Parvarchaeota archaeon]